MPSSLVSTGTPPQQITFFTNRIVALTDHLKRHPKDQSSKRGLLLAVSKRTKMIQYLKRKDYALYTQTCESLSIRR